MDPRLRKTRTRVASTSWRVNQRPISYNRVSACEQLHRAQRKVSVAQAVQAAGGPFTPARTGPYWRGRPRRLPADVIPKIVDWAHGMVQAHTAKKPLMHVVHHVAAAPPAVHRSGIRLRTKGHRAAPRPRPGRRPRLGQRRAQRVVRRRRRSEAPPQRRPGPDIFATRFAVALPDRGAPSARRTPRARSASRPASPARRARFSEGVAPQPSNADSLERLASRWSTKSRRSAAERRTPSSTNCSTFFAPRDPLPKSSAPRLRGVQLQPTRRLGVALDTGGARDLAVARGLCRRAAPRTFERRQAPMPSIAGAICGITSPARFTKTESPIRAPPSGPTNTSKLWACRPRAVALPRSRAPVWRPMCLLSNRPTPISTSSRVVVTTITSLSSLGPQPAGLRAVKPACASALAASTLKTTPSIS